MNLPFWQHLALAALLFHPANLPGQEEPPQERAPKAIAAYESLRQQPGKERQRDKALQWLGEIDEPAVVDYLRAELAAAGDSARAAAVVAALACIPRKEVEPELTALVLRPSAPATARAAAVLAIAAMGDRGADHMIELACGDDARAMRPIRMAVFAALVRTKADRTLRALVPMLDRGSAEERLECLRLLRDVAGLAPLSLARIKLMQHDNLALATAAWRDLAVEGHERSRALALDIIERLPEVVPPAVAADAILALCIVKDADFYPLILRLARSKAAGIKQAVRDGAPFAAKDAALLRFMVHEGLEDENPDARWAARELLKLAPADAVQPLLAKVRDALKRGKPESLDLAIGLHDLLRRDPSWRSDLLAMVLSKDVPTRTAGLTMLAELDVGDAQGIAQQSVNAKEWQLRSAAYRYLSRFRTVDSIPMLIARYGKEEGRLQDELHQALFRHSGTRCWSKKEWETWWKEHAEGFVLPREETVQTSLGSGSGQTSAYYGVPMVSTRVAFLLDHSGSMREQIGTDRKFNRLEAAKKQLALVLEKLPATHMANLVPYDSTPHPLWRELRLLEEPNRAEMLARVKSLRPTTGTNIFDSLEAAFADPTVDTIYLLTDGEPSAGKLVAVDDILAEVTRWHRTRQIVVHCVAVGLDSHLLRGIARVTGGEYRQVK